MKEQQFWNVIEAMDFNNKGYKKAGQYLIEDSGLTIEQMSEVEDMASWKVRELYDRLWDVKGVSDDSYDDLRWQIVANGQDAFNDATVESAQKMVDNKEYTESFCYAFHALWDLQK